jgi:hypothetical protein
MAGLKNGNLLAAAEAVGFDAPITVDQYPYQQNLATGKIAVLILCVKTNRLNDLRKLTSEALAALEVISPGQVMRLRYIP